MHQILARKLRPVAHGNPSPDEQKLNSLRHQAMREQYEHDKKADARFTTAVTVTLVAIAGLTAYIAYDIVKTHQPISLLPAAQP